MLITKITIYATVALNKCALIEIVPTLVKWKAE